MKNFIKYIFSLIALTLSFQVLIAQTTLQVVTKKIEKVFEYTTSTNLLIRAEKGVIDIKPCKENKVIVEINIIVKNKDLNIAKKELEYIKWSSFQNYNVVQLSNTINLPKNITLESIVRVEYIIQVPQGVNLTIQNSFGQVKMSDITCIGRIDIQYCDLIMKNVSGTGKITSNIGDLNFYNVNGNIQITSRYSKLMVTDPQGIYDVSSTYGDVQLNINKNFVSLNLKTERCDVFISNKTCQEINLNLENKYGELNVLESCYIKNKVKLQKVSESSAPNITNKYNYTAGDKYPKVKITSVFGNITLN
jgi:hypothetical protein